MNARVADGNDPVTGHIISTTIGGKNGEPKQVIILGDTFLFTFLFFMVVLSYTVFMIWCWRINIWLMFLFVQTISYMAERVVGTGSFGIVFQVSKCVYLLEVLAIMYASTNWSISCCRQNVWNLGRRWR